MKQIRAIFDWRKPRTILVCVALVPATIALFYAVENWRGRRAWEQCKREFASKGTPLDWPAYLPKPIPDEQNIFKAPQMREWFVREGGWSWDYSPPGSKLTKLLSIDTLADFVHDRRTNAVVEVTLISSNDTHTIDSADLLLHYRHRVLYAATSNDLTRPPAEKIPYIKFEEIPLSSAIANMAKQIDLKYVLDAGVKNWLALAGGEPNISIKWENISIEDALFELLELYDLIWVENPMVGVATIKLGSEQKTRIVIQDSARDRFNEAIQPVIAGTSAATNAPNLFNVRNLKLVTNSLAPAPNMRMVVLSAEDHGTNDVNNFFPRESNFSASSKWRVQAVNSNTFHANLKNLEVCSVNDYLAWSDQFEPEFEIIRKGLQRPLAQIDGDYTDPIEAPRPDYVCIRALAQMLAERAQCYLLLGQPEKALDELTLLQDLRRLLASKPVTLVSAMIDTAITGLYTSIIADGLRLNAWSEAELVALQQQLARINLTTNVVLSLSTERAGLCHAILEAKADEVADYFRLTDVVGGIPQLASVWEKVSDPVAIFLKLAPRGWLYQNLATTARVKQSEIIGAFNSEKRAFQPREILTETEMEKALGAWSPYNAVARVATISFARALQTTARNQSRVDQAFIICGLERYHRAHARYPETLVDLLPQFIDKLPNDIIGGEPLKYGRTDAGKFLLYSIGWNETDDGGTITRGKDGAIDFDSPDWVWQITLP